MIIGAAHKRIFLATYRCLEDARTLYDKFGFTIYKKNKDIERYGYTFDQEFWEKAREEKSLRPVTLRLGQ